MARSLRWRAARFVSVSRSFLPNSDNPHVYSSLLHPRRLMMRSVIFVVALMVLFTGTSFAQATTGSGQKWTRKPGQRLK